jgi:cation:H+ antiporter
MIDLAMLLGGLVLLYFGAEWVVSGAARLAESFGVSPLVVGLTVVAYGTSAPELVVGIGAGLRDQGALALGNVIGSNIANVGLILGVVALIAPPRIDPVLARREVWVLIVGTALVPIMLIGGRIQLWEGVVLLTLAAAYSVWTVISARLALPQTRHPAAPLAAGAAAQRLRRRLLLALLTLVGLAVLVAGGHFLIEGAIGLARWLGMTERLIGLTIVAVGTSLPELATCGVAAYRGHSDLAVGNVIGSNIFNVLLILGASSVAGPIRAAPVLDLVALGVMTAAAAGLLLLRDRVSRAEAVLLLLGYVGFLSALALV